MTSNFGSCLQLSIVNGHVRRMSDGRMHAVLGAEHDTGSFVELDEPLEH